MRYKFTGTSKVIRIGQPFTDLKGIQYPANWLDLTTSEEKTAIGLEEISPPPQPKPYDSDYYYSFENPRPLDDSLRTDIDGNPVYEQEYDASANEGRGGMVNKTPLVQEIDRGLKYNMTQRMKATANRELKDTDWYVIRKAERGTDIPASVGLERSHKLEECYRLETEISKAADVEALKKIINSQNWKI